jgi:hypothetical protein
MKNLILCLGLSLVACLGYAQTKAPITTDGTASGGDSKVYIKIYGSYGLPTSGSYRAVDINAGFPILYGGVSVARASGNLHYQTIERGLGQGVRVGGGVGLVISDFINLGIDADYYRSGNINILSYTTSANAEIISSNMEASMITILPNVTFKALSKPSFYVYMRLGIGLGIPDVKQDYVNTLNGAVITSQNYAFKGGLALGYLVSLGVQKRLTPQLRAFAEAQFINFSYSPKQRNTTAWLAGGKGGTVITPPTSVLAAKNLSETEIQYYDDYTVSTLQDEKEKQPAKSARLTMPIASLGLQIGLAYRF